MTAACQKMGSNIKVINVLSFLLFGFGTVDRIVEIVNLYSVF